MLAADSASKSLLATDSEASGSQLLGELGEGLLSLGDLGSLLGAVELDVAVRGEVGGDTTVSTVGSAATLLGTLDSNVGDDALVDIEGLGLAVGLQVDEKEADSLDGLLGPSAGVGANGLALSVSLGEMLGEANNGLVLKDLVHVVDGSLNSHTFDSVGDVVSVLEVGALVLHFGHSGLGGLSGLSRVLNHSLVAVGRMTESVKERCRKDASSVPSSTNSRKVCFMTSFISGAIPMAAAIWAQHRTK